MRPHHSPVLQFPPVLAVWQCVRRAHASSPAASPLSPHSRRSTRRHTRPVPWLCQLHRSRADPVQHKTLWHCPRHLSWVRSATRRWHFCRSPLGTPAVLTAGDGEDGRCRERGAGGVGCRCGTEGTEGLEEEKGQLRRAEQAAARRREAAEVQRCRCPASAGRGWALGMRLLGTWPAISDVGRRTPESTSAEERVATQRPLCSSGPHPVLPLLSQFIYPSSKDSLTVPRGWLKWPRGGL